MVHGQYLLWDETRVTMVTDETKKIFEDYRKELLERQRLDATQFDQAILTLSTASLGVSISFISNVVCLKTAVGLALLKLSWVCFGLAIISTVVSFMTSQRAMNTQMNYAEKYYLENREEFRTKKSPWSKTTDCLNFLSVVIFLTAIFLIITFVIINI
jgi:hypothetical protein